VAASRLRFLAAVIAARGSRDRAALDVLLEVDDLPQGWRQQRQARYRIGFGFNEEWDRRARRNKLVGGSRVFVHPESGGRLVAQAFPTISEEDAVAALTNIWERRFLSLDLNAQHADEVEVTPPSEAGEHARALLIANAGRTGDSRKLFVAWAEPAPMFFGVVLTSPAELEFWELMSRLVKRQRERFAPR
jgi:hypothetical protein